jgi:phage terminase small subunit
VSTGPSTPQTELFSLETIEGYGVLDARKQKFALALFEGHTQREAARLAGYAGDDATLDVQASKLVRSPKMQGLMTQAWSRSGASIDRTLCQAAELQQQAFLEATTAQNRTERLEAFRKWKDASALIASIHGKLTVNVSGKIDHTINANMVYVPAEALDGLARMRRRVEIELDGGTT